jgi:hypothetical protein
MHGGKWSMPDWTTAELLSSGVDGLMALDYTNYELNARFTSTKVGSLSFAGITTKHIAKYVITGSVIQITQGTVTEDSGALAGITTLNMSGILTINNATFRVHNTSSMNIGVGSDPSGIGTDNTMIGNGVGISLTDGFLNSFYGSNTGAHVTNGIRNAFFGGGAGDGVITGHINSCFGVGAGFALSIGATKSLVLACLTDNDGLHAATSVYIGRQDSTNCVNFFMPGIYNRTIGAVNHLLSIDSTGKIGKAP